MGDHTRKCLLPNHLNTVPEKVINMIDMIDMINMIGTSHRTLLLTARNGHVKTVPTEVTEGPKNQRSECGRKLWIENLILV